MNQNMYFKIFSILILHNGTFRDNSGLKIWWDKNECIVRSKCMRDFFILLRDLAKKCMIFSALLWDFSSHLGIFFFCTKNMSKSLTFSPQNNPCTLYSPPLPRQMPSKIGSSIGSEFTWHASGPEFDPHVRHILSWRLGHENISMAILPLPLIQEEQLSVTGERMSTKYW